MTALDRKVGFPAVGKACKASFRMSIPAVIIRKKKGIRRVNCVLAPSTSRERDNVVCEREGRDGTARAM